MKGFLASMFGLVSTPRDRGVGVDNNAVVQTAHPTYSIYGPRYNIKRSFALSTTGGQLYLSEAAPIVGIEGNGSEIAGQYALQSLQKAMKANG
jgi:hypothetical protein